MSRKTYTQARPPLEPIDVTISGYWQMEPEDWYDTHEEGDDSWQSDEWSEDYTFLRHAPFSEVGRLVGSFSMGDNGTQINQLDLVRFLVRAVHPRDQRRLAKMLDDNRRVVTVEQMTSLAMDLVSELTGKRPSTR